MNILITAGGTKEAIDQVRHITNMSSGSLGREILTKAQLEPSIEKIYFLSPKTAFPSNDRVMSKTHLIQTESVEDLQNNLQNILTTEKIDAVIHSMAVSDFTTAGVFTNEDLASYLNVEMGNKEVSYELILNLLNKIDEYKIDNSSKISSKSEHMNIALKPTPKVIGNIKKWSPNTVLIGFKLLENVSDSELINVAREQMKKNGCDFVWANDIKRIRQNGHQGILVEKNNYTHIEGKDSIAKGIIDTIIFYVKD